MTSMDLERRGLWVDRSGQWPKAIGPSRQDDPDFGSDLRYEIEMRTEIVGDGVVFKTVYASVMPIGRTPVVPRDFNRCAHCRDRWSTYGTCLLCELARGRMLKARWEKEQKVAKALGGDDLPY